MTESENSNGVPASNCFFELMQNLYCAVYFDMHVNLPAQMDTSAPRWVFEGVQTVTQSPSLHSTAQKCSIFITAVDVQEATYCSMIQTVRGAKSRSYAATLLLKTSRTSASPLSGKQKNSSQIEIEIQQPVGGPTWISNWDRISLTKKNKQTPKERKRETNKWLWATCHIHLLWYQIAKRLS